MYCVNCGALLPPNATLCEKCGSVPGSSSGWGPNSERITSAIERNAATTDRIYDLLVVIAAVIGVYFIFEILLAWL